MKRTLVLDRETLSELTDADLAGVVGGAWRITESGYSCGIRPCEGPEYTLLCDHTLTGC